MTVAAIHQPQYLPYLGFFHKLASCDVFVVLDDVQFHRRGLQHRNKIKDSHGWQWLTVPIVQRSDQLVSDVEVHPTEPWQRKHTNAVRWNYGRAPFFERYAHEVIEILEEPWTGLAELNMALIRWVTETLGIERPFVASSEFDVDGSGSERLANLCREVGASTYLSGPGGRRYMDLEVFDREGIDVRWQDFEHPTYTQLFPDVGFIPNLSIIDALLCCGPDVKAFLESP
jgi:hypothetical protein